MSAVAFILSYFVNYFRDMQGKAHKQNFSIIWWMYKRTLQTNARLDEWMNSFNHVWWRWRWEWWQNDDDDDDDE